MSWLDEHTFEQMLARASPAREFVMSTGEVKAGQGLIGGWDQPLTDYSADKQPGPKRSRRSSGGR